MVTMIFFNLTTIYYNITGFRKKTLFEADLLANINYIFVEKFKTFIKKNNYEGLPRFFEII